MKKFMNILLVSFFGIVATSSVFAQGVPIVGPVGDFSTLLGNVFGIIRPFIIISFLGVMIWGGYLRMTAAGNAEQEENSVKTLVAGIIGFIIIVLAPVLVSILQQLLNINPIT